jgi:putative flippase GtrA
MQSPLASNDVRHSPAAPGPFAYFLRFVVCGGGVGVLSSAAVPLLGLLTPWALANAVITIASAILCTGLHALFTFGAGRRPGLREHWQSAGSAVAGYAVTCAATFILHAVQSSPSTPTEQIVYLGASGITGTGRFLILRLFVFAATDKADDHRTAWFVPAVPRPTHCRRRREPGDGIKSPWRRPNTGRQPRV